MQVKFLGAARGVTGSCFVLVAGHSRFAVDCGMHQGAQEVEQRNQNLDIYDAPNLDFVLLTHAHIDHCGLLPALVKAGFKGRIFCTLPTVDLLEIMLRDSAHIQEMEAEWASKKKARHGRVNKVQPLYTGSDVDRTLSLVDAVEYNQEFSPCEEISVLYKDAGHILGSAIIEIRAGLKENGQAKLVFSGDLGRPNQLLMRNPSRSEVADFLFLESTYGNRDHKDEDQSREELLQAINYSYQSGEKVIIPAFALERTQEVLYSLYLLHQEGRLPRDMPLFLDSPLAIRATQVFSKHYRYFDAQTREIFQAGNDPLNLPNLRLAQSAQDSMNINSYKGSAIIISASGMANAGRIKHHLRHNIWRKGASIVFVGFQAQGTTGRKIVDGADSIRLLGEELAVRARVFTINGFSAHAGQSQILRWLSGFYNPEMKIFLVHGEYESQLALAEKIREQLGYEVHIPEYLEECFLKPDRGYEARVPAGQQQKNVNWDYVLGELDEKINSLRLHEADLSAMAPEEQVRLRDDLLDISSGISRVIAGIDSRSNSS